MVRVGFVIIKIRIRSWTHGGLIEGQKLESAWTIVPAILLIILAVPSLSILYGLDEIGGVEVTLKILGHQWYWSYEYRESWGLEGTISIDSYIVPQCEMGEIILRLLDTDRRPCLPVYVPIRALVSRTDVLHSWAVPSLGVKVDATPGRLNQTKLMGELPGVVYGQCSEICGANHRFMPIRVEFVSSQDYLAWVRAYSDISE